MTPFTHEMISKIIKDQDLASLTARNFFTALSSSGPKLTSSGHSIDVPVSTAEADNLVSPITDYLNKNFEILCGAMDMKMAQGVIRLLWEDILLYVENILVPALFGQIESSRRIFNVRQTSLIKCMLVILRDFVNHDGEEMGIPLSVLQSPRYYDLMHLMEIYFIDLIRVRRDYELMLSQGKDNELVIRLFRFRLERESSELTNSQRDEQKKWFASQIIKRQWVHYQRSVAK
jgi:hypothetical protein